MDKVRLAELEIALERERRTMKRQELLRQIWKGRRGGNHEQSVSGQLDTERTRQQKILETRTKSLLLAQGNSKLHPDSASTAI
jgi:hypothetical protein